MSRGFNENASTHPSFGTHRARGYGVSARKICANALYAAVGREPEGRTTSSAHLAVMSEVDTYRHRTPEHQTSLLPTSRCYGPRMTATEGSMAGDALPRGVRIARASCALVVLLLVAAIVYGGVIVIQNYGHISV